MSGISSIQEKIQTLKTQIIETTSLDAVIMDIEVNQIARRILHTPMTPSTRKIMLRDLLELRARLIHHVPVNGLTGNVLFLNLIQDVAPTPICPAYNKMQFPTVTTYGNIGSNISCMRLDPKGLEFVPRTVLEQAGPLDGKQVDLLWTAIDGRFYHFNRSLNHSSHAWAHRHALPGPEKNPDSDISFDVDVGLFPEIGYEKANEAGAIAINQISPMKVHVHADYRNRAPKASDMLYSPDNSHFEVIPGTPFGIDWSVMKKDDRVAITKRLVIFDYTHPICTALLNSIRRKEFHEHLQDLKTVPNAISLTFDHVIKAFEENQQAAMDTFHQLPLAFQYGIYREAWLSFDSPVGLHGDFGRASFENQPTLNASSHCSNARRAEAVRAFCKRLESLLVESQLQLLFQSQSLVKGDNILSMMRCAELFKKDPQAGLEAFNSELTDQQKEAIRFAFWELSGCPRVSNFGSTQFPLHCNNSEAVPLKIQAILLAASRQAHQFATPIVEAQLLPEENPPEITSFSSEIKPSQTAAKKEKEESSSSSNSSANTVHPSSVREFRSEQEFLQNDLINLVLSAEFTSLGKSEQTERVNLILSCLEKGTRDRIYGRIYSYSQDPHKGGNAWGENHVADDLNVLLGSIQDELS